jgi:hypothetical protein
VVAVALEALVKMELSRHRQLLGEETAEQAQVFLVEALMVAAVVEQDFGLQVVEAMVAAMAAVL